MMLIKIFVVFYKFRLNNAIQNTEQMKTVSVYLIVYPYYFYSTNSSECLVIVSSETGELGTRQRYFFVLISYQGKQPYEERLCFCVISQSSVSFPTVKMFVI